ncbi:MAG: stage II sporulation protein M [Halobacteriales archaeon]
MRRTVPVFVVAAALNGVGILLGVAWGTPSSALGIRPSATLSVASVFTYDAAIALALAAGGVLLGAPTVALLVITGFLLGAGVGPGVDPLLVLAHAVFEVPAIWAAGTAGLLLPRSLIRDLRRPEERGTVARVVPRALFFTTVSIGLLVIAAVMEVFVTSWFTGA